MPSSHSEGCHKKPNETSITGVVIWSDTKRKLAVIWCRDHGRLAYAAGSEDLLDGEDWPQRGDLVGFWLASIAGLRHCSDLHVIEHNWHPDLARILAETASSGVIQQDDSAPPASAEIVPIRQVRLAR